MAFVVHACGLVIRDRCRAFPCRLEQDGPLRVDHYCITALSNPPLYYVFFVRSIYRSNRIDQNCLKFYVSSQVCPNTV